MIRVRALLLAACLAAFPATASAQPSTSAFEALLARHVNAGSVDYPAFRDAPAFHAYVDGLGKPVTPAGRAETLAYYINAYNALAIQGIVDGLSPSSFLGRQRYFKLKEWPLAGRRISLHDLEHQVLRPIGDPRIHFAIVCASKSCPALRGEAYVAARLDAQLDDQARRFVNDPTRNRFDMATRTAHLSEIFRWFDEDFRSAGSVQKYVARFVDDADVARRLANDEFRVAWTDYDWSLNGTPPTR